MGYSLLKTPLVTKRFYGEEPFLRREVDVCFLRKSPPPLLDHDENNEGVISFTKLQKQEVEFHFLLNHRSGTQVLISMKRKTETWRYSSKGINLTPPEGKTCFAIKLFVSCSILGRTDLICSPISKCHCVHLQPV